MYQASEYEEAIRIKQELAYAVLRPGLACPKARGQAGPPSQELLLLLSSGEFRRQGNLSSAFLSMHRIGTSRLPRTSLTQVAMGLGHICRIRL